MITEDHMNTLILFYDCRGSYPHENYLFELVYDYKGSCPHENANVDTGL